MNQKHVFIIAGESSGDQHAANYVREHKRLNPNTHFSAIGQQELKDEGVNIIFDSEVISVVGIIEVISKYGKIREALNITYNHIINNKPDLIILVDYVEFNLKIAVFAKSKNIPVLFYIAPQVWAWRDKRIKKIVDVVDELAVIFPFEEKLFKKYTNHVTYVGHPLADKKEFSPSSLQNKIDYKNPTIGIFPGSRVTEIKNNLNRMMLVFSHQKMIRLANYKIFYSNKTAKKFILDKYPEESQFLFSGKNLDEIKKCDKAITASGTITLELALLGIPMVIMYRLSPISYFIMKRLVKLKYIGLVNLILGDQLGSRPIVPEFIQTNDIGEIGKELESLDVGTIKNNYKEIRKALKPGASINVARLANKMLE